MGLFSNSFIISGTAAASPASTVNTYNFTSYIGNFGDYTTGEVDIGVAIWQITGNTPTVFIWGLIAIGNKAGVNQDYIGLPSTGDFATIDLFSATKTDIQMDSRTYKFSKPT